MSDTIQVIRVDATVRRIGQTRVLVRMGDGGHRVVAVGDVIELTQVRRDVAGQNDDGNLNGEDYVETRLVSEWEATR